jgi:hypothetical protein
MQSGTGRFVRVLVFGRDGKHYLRIAHVLSCSVGMRESYLPRQELSEQHRDAGDVTDWRDSLFAPSHGDNRRAKCSPSKRFPRRR